MESPIRVLHVVVNMNRGGAETLIMNLYRNMNRSKIQFDFLTCKEGVFDQEIKELGGIIHRIPYISESGHFQYIKNLNNFFKTNKNYNIIHSHMDKMSGFVLKAAKRAKIPVRIAHSHNTKSEGSFIARLYKNYAGSNIVQHATHYFACSTLAAKWLFNSKIQSTFFLKNGIEVEKFSYDKAIRKIVRYELDIEDSSTVIGHVGRFNHQKNHHFLIDVFFEVSKENREVYLVLAGDGPLRKEIEEKVQILGLDQRVIFVGVRSDIHCLLQAFDLFIFPSFHEGLPVTLIEAQGAGLPCIISTNITEEVDMELGLVKYLPLDDTNLWINEIGRLSNLSNNRLMSPEALTNQGYNIKNTAKYMNNLYQEIGSWNP